MKMTSESTSDLGACVHFYSESLVSLNSPEVDESSNLRNSQRFQIVWTTKLSTYLTYREIPVALKYRKPHITLDTSGEVYTI